MDLFKQLGMSNPARVFDEIDRTNLEKRKQKELESWRQEQTALAAPVRRLQAEKMAREARDYMTPEQKEAADLNAYLKRKEIDARLQKPEKEDYHYFERPDGVYAVGRNGRSFRVSGVPGKGEDEPPEKRYSAQVGQYQSLMNRRAEIAAGQNQYLPNPNRDAVLDMIDKRMDSMGKYLLGLGVSPGALGMEAPQTPAPEAQPQPANQADFDGKNVLINGSSYPVGKDGSVTINGVKYRVTR